MADVPVVQENKVQFGLRNLYFAKQTETIDPQTGAVTYSYESPKAVPGAVSLTATAQGDSSTFYADDVAYYRSNTNSGYSGTVEIALVPDWVAEEYFGDTEDANGVQFENMNASDLPKCAMLFEFQGDVKATRHALYNCTLSRPDMEGNTEEDKLSVKTSKINYTCDPRKDGVIKAKTTAKTQDSAYESWYKTVPQMTAAVPKK